MPASSESPAIPVAMETGATYEIHILTEHHGWSNDASLLGAATQEANSWPTEAAAMAASPTLQQHGWNAAARLA